MYKIKVHIQRFVVLLVLLLSSVFTYAQLTAKVGDITTLSVSKVSGDTYAWELYDVATGVNFVTGAGNCPTSKAQFVNGKSTGASVKVKWLAEGEYFYKVTERNSCTNNVKIGRVLITAAAIPPKPTVGITYNRTSGTAELTALEYTGALLWSTGETSRSITVTEPGNYTVTQVVNGQRSEEAIAKVTPIKTTAPTSAMALPPKIEEGGVAELVAEGCGEGGTLYWYADKSLTQELSDTKVAPTKTTTYYVICENEAGCRSEALPVTVEVGKYDKCEKMYENLTMEQLLTPNGDGINDKWELKEVLEYCIECGKRAHVRLFNRWGAKVYEKDGYMFDDERFEGYSKNDLNYKGEEQLPSGTYFYIIMFNGKKDKTGFITIANDK